VHQVANSGRTYQMQCISPRKQCGKFSTISSMIKSCVTVKVKCCCQIQRIMPKSAELSPVNFYSRVSSKWHIWLISYNAFQNPVGNPSDLPENRGHISKTSYPQFSIAKYPNYKIQSSSKCYLLISSISRSGCYLVTLNVTCTLKMLEK